MAGFFRRVAGAFIEVEKSEQARSGKAEASGDARNLDEITRGASELLAQLETVQSSETGPRGGDQGADRPAAPAIELPAGSLMALTAEQVFSHAGMGDGPHTAPRVLKIIAGLSMFPTEQQVVMVRAMDQADESWSEDQVLEDARRRQSALRSHLTSLEGERTARLQALDGEIQAAQGSGKQLTEELERQIADLQIQREAAISDTSAALTRLEQQKREVEQQAEQARRGITHVINALSGLMGFFGQRSAQ